jgi:flagellar FliJ protein
MSSLNALQVAIDVAARRRDEALQALMQQQRMQQAGQAQLDQLSLYADQTQQRWGARADTLVQPEVMRHHYQFMGRLDEAIGMQGSVVHNQGVRVELARKALLDAELRLASLKKLVERKQKELAQLQMQREQKQTDERAAMQFGRLQRRP